MKNLVTLVFRLKESQDMSRFRDALSQHIKTIIPQQYNSNKRKGIL